jgi:exodeoxyribonuclease VII large subunit
MSLFDQPFEDDDIPLEDAAAPPRPERKIYSVSELTAGIRGVLETAFGEIWVEGEISNCKVWTSGHMYFTLKDGAAQIKGVMFRTSLRYLRFKPADGLRVVARGQLSVYDPKGEYQLACEHMEPMGLGALQLAFEQLKKKLQAEGLFERARKRALPALPRRIGIVTSLDGAALRDILKVLKRRAPHASVLIRPARVQGDDAVADVVTALRQIAKAPGVDVVIVARGGGSIEDLWAFNEEKVARAIVTCPVPVVAGVGHGTEVTRRGLRRGSARADAVRGGRDGGRGARRVLRAHRSAHRTSGRGRGCGPATAAHGRAPLEQPARARQLPGTCRDARPSRL